MPRRPTLSLLLATALAAALLSLPASAVAAVLNVTKEADTADGACDADCSLREAVIAANADPGSTINLPPGRYLLTRAGVDDTSILGDLDVTESTTILGAGAGSTVVDAGGAAGIGDRVFELFAGTQITSVSGLTVTGGFGQTGAGFRLAIPPTGETNRLELADAVITGNQGLASGGAIELKPGSEAVIDDTTISDNSTGGTVLGVDPGGGAIIVEVAGAGPPGPPAELTMTDSTISGNRAGSGGLAGGGGAILNQGTTELTNVTISGNSVGGALGAGLGGGVFSTGSTTIVNSTIVENSARGPVGGLGFGGNISTVAPVPPDGTVTLRNTIVAGGTATAGSENCDGTGFVSQGGNLESSNQCLLNPPADLTGTNPLLEQLADNGGPTRTHGLRPASPAIDAAGAGCPPPDADQRGVARPQGAACDIGAFELVPDAPAPGGSGPAEEAKCKGRTATITGTDGDDVIAGTGGRDVIVTFGGADRIKAKGGNDLVCSRTGRDRVLGGAGNDTLRGDGGGGTLVGGKGDDELHGARSRDVERGGSGDDTLHGGAGPDDLNGGAGVDDCIGQRGRDFATGCEAESQIP